LYVRNVVARTFTASSNGASPNFTTRSGVGVGEDAAKIVYSGRLTDRQFRDAEYADTAYVGAGRPCKALLERRVRKSYVRNVVARTFTASSNGASPIFTARNGVGVGEDAAHLGTQRRLSHQKKRSACSVTATCHFPQFCSRKRNLKLFVSIGRHFLESRRFGRDPGKI
jgi:hypothetical protein